MNQFVVLDGTKEHLSLRDILYWVKYDSDTLLSGQFMVHQTPDSRIGLLNFETAIAYPRTFANLDELEQYFRRKETVDDKIYVIRTEDWDVDVDIAKAV